MCFGRMERQSFFQRIAEFSDEKFLAIFSAQSGCCGKVTGEAAFFRWSTVSAVSGENARRAVRVRRADVDGVVRKSQNPFKKIRIHS